MHFSLRAGLSLAGLLGLVALGACGGNVVVDTATGTGGHGGATTTSYLTTSYFTTSDFTTTTFSGTTSSVSSSSGTITDPCATGADCSQCTDFSGCSTCLGIAHPVGQKLYETAVNCILCDACYTVCEGATQGCASPPTVKDACDVGTPSMPGMGACGGGGMGNTGCIACAEKPGSSCYAALQACTSNTECTDYANSLQTCPTG